MKRNIIYSSGGSKFEITSRYLYQISIDSDNDGKRFRRVRLTDLHIALGYYVGFGWFVTGQVRFPFLASQGWKDQEWRAQYHHEHHAITIGCMRFEGRSATRILKAAKVKR